MYKSHVYAAAEGKKKVNVFFLYRKVVERIEKERERERAVCRSICTGVRSSIVVWWRRPKRRPGAQAAVGVLAEGGEGEGETRKKKKEEGVCDPVAGKRSYFFLLLLLLLLLL